MTTDTPKTEALEGVRELPELPDTLILRTLHVSRPPSAPFLVRGYTANQMREYALAALAATPAAPRSAAPGWMLIDEAAKHAGWILVCGRDKTGARRMVVRWDGDGWESSDDGYYAYITPTHWQPLPPPVTPSEGGKHARQSEQDSAS